MPRRKQSIIDMPQEDKVIKKNKKVKEEKSIELIAVEVALQKVEEHHEFLEILAEVKEAHKDKWDIPITEHVLFFDTELSYELTGYKPINKEKGLDFNPALFTEAKDAFLRTGHYCLFPRNTKAYADFWNNEYLRCRKGMTANGYTITGDHYFFLNYYQLMDLDSAELAGSGRVYAFPTFYVGQYEWFHYVELCRKLRLNAVLMKSREVGFSEIDAAIIVNSYNSVRNSINLITAHSSDHLDKTLEKVWRAMAFINDYTDGGFFKLRQVNDTAYKKRASVYKIVNGQKIETGWMSLIQGIVADKPSKIRGDRTDLLIFEEAGSWDGLIKAFIQCNALVGQPRRLWGIRILGGTGGDSGKPLEGLKEMYYNPTSYGILPFRHKFTSSGEQILSAFFIPCTKIMKYKGFYDARGFVDPDKAKNYWEKTRASMAASPKALLLQCAEYCYTAEEAFALEGDNKFDKTIIAELLAQIRALKTAPKVEIGNLSFTYKSALHTKENINGFKWEENINTGKIHILEHPVWTELYKDLINRMIKEKGESIDISDYSEMNNLYVAGIDGIDIGQGQTSEFTDDPSKFAIIIMRRTFGTQEPQLVAYYKERPENERTAFKIAMCLIKYYNAVVNIEATRMSMYSFAKEQGFYNHFMARPRATIPESANGKRIRTIGTPATPAIISHQTDLIANFIEDYGHLIWFEEVLDELSSYNDENKRKFDLVAALGMTLLADEELGNIVATKVLKIDLEVYLDVGYYIDERGYRRWGIIPTKPKNDFIYDESVFRGSRTSDPRTWGVG